MTPAAEPPPYDPDSPSAVVSEPSERELRGLRRVVTDRLGGTVLPDAHIGRIFRMKQAPGKFASVGVSLATCGRERVLCDIPQEDGGAPIRICLVCDAGRELLGLNGKPI